MGGVAVLFFGETFVVAARRLGAVCFADVRFEGVFFLLERLFSATRLPRLFFFMRAMLQEKGSTQQSAAGIQPVRRL